MKIAWISFIIFVLPVTLSAAGNINGIEKNYDPSIKIVQYLPGEYFGIYDKGKNADFSLMIDSMKAGKVKVDYDLVDYYGKKCSSSSFTQTIKEGRTKFKIQVPAPEKYGHFTLDTKIYLNGEPAASTQSAFVVLPRAIEKADPYFELDGRNPHYMVNLLPAFKRIGVGTIALTDFIDPACPDLYLRTYFAQPRELQFDNVVCYIGLPGPGFKLKKMHNRVVKNLPPYSDEDYEVYEKSLRTIVRAAHGRIKFWDAVQEVDGWMMRSDVSPAGVMADNIIRVKRFAKVLREEVPDSTLAVMNSCGTDFFQNDFRFVRMLLNEVAKYVDSFSIDGYSGSWNGVLGPMGEPELNNRFKAIMNGCIKMAAEFGMKPGVYQVERGYFLPYSDALNSPKSHDWANLNVRSTIIARSITGIHRYSQHGACMHYLPYQVKKGANPDTLPDNGMWRSVYDANGRYALQPRPGVCAYATLTRMMAFVSDPVEKRITKEIHSFHFKRPDGKRIIAIWTTATDAKAIFDFPVEAEVTDLMGNTETVKGKHRIVISQAPTFIVVPLNSAEISNLLDTIVFPDITTFKSFARTIGPDTYEIIVVSFNNRDLTLKVKPVNGQKVPESILLKAGATEKIHATGKPGKVELCANGKSETVQVPYEEAFPVKYGKQPQKIATINYPENVRPYSALRSEMHLFRNDGTDISADFSASWDEDYLYLDFLVRDVIHIQRKTGGDIWMDDSIQFAIDAANSAMPKNIVPMKVFDSTIHNFGLALTKTGPYCHAWQNGKEKAGNRDFKTLVEHKNGVTHYYTAIPWTVLAPLKPLKGTAFGFSFIVWDNNQLANRTALYHLCWTEGIANGQDASKFKTLILQ